MPSFPDRLKELRKFKKLKQTDIAAFLELNIRTYQDYEYGNVIPNATTLSNLADFFGVSVDYILGRVNYFQDAAGNITVKIPPDIPLKRPAAD